MSGASIAIRIIFTSATMYFLLGIMIITFSGDQKAAGKWLKRITIPAITPAVTALIWIFWHV